MRFTPILLLKRAIFRKETSLVAYKGKCSFERMSESSNEVLQNKYFTSKLKYGYDGFLVYDNKQNLIGYYWYTLNQPSIINLPKIPKNTPWVFNMYVYKGHRGHGYQKEMFKHFEATFSDFRWVFGDVRLNNAPSVKSFLKVDYLEIGVYYIVVIGIRRIRSLNYKFGYWNKKKKHIYKF